MDKKLKISLIVGGVLVLSGGVFMVAKAINTKKKKLAALKKQQDEIATNQQLAEQSQTADPLTTVSVGSVTPSLIPDSIKNAKFGIDKNRLYAMEQQLRNMGIQVPKPSYSSVKIPTFAEYQAKKLEQQTNLNPFKLK